MFAKRKKGWSGWGIFTRERRPRNTARPERLRRFEPLEPRLMLATDVSGAVEGVWNLAGSPYRLVGHTTVEQGKTLTIEPGVQVTTDLFNSNRNIFDFTIDGALNVTDAWFVNYTDLIVRSGGTLNMTGTSLSGGNVTNESSQVWFQPGASGQITGSTFNIPVVQYSGSKASPLVSFSGNTFTTATPVYTPTGHWSRISRTTTPSTTRAARQV